MRKDDGFTGFFADLYPTAYRLAWRLVGNVTVAEDIAAEALARVYLRWPRVRAMERREAWALRVTTNLAIDHLRRRPPPVTTERLADDAETATTRIALGAALSALPRRQREVVVLRYLHGYSQGEVAGALGLSPETVKTHLQRAVGAMRRTLGDDFGRPDTIAT